MRYLSLILIACGMASLAAPSAYAFDIQGENANLQDQDNSGVAPFTAPVDPLTGAPDFTKGSSLALPYISNTDSGFTSEYGNMIVIPGPGVDRPAPAWAYR
jgi:hypothetical protein